MADFRFFNRAAVWHLGFLRIGNFNCQAASVHICADQSNRSKDMAIFRSFKMVAIRHLGFLKVENFYLPSHIGRPMCIMEKILNCSGYMAIF